MTEKLSSILKAEGLDQLLSKFTDQGVTDSILGDLTDADLKELGVEKLGERKRLLAAFKESTPSLSVTETPNATTSTHAPDAPTTAATPSAATKERPFINSLGMPFVPIPRFDTRFCIWPVRVQDYEVFCMATGTTFPSCPFSQEGNHPVVSISWYAAKAFCKWLTEKERSEGKIDKESAYRLASDLEWSAAVGLPHEPEDCPANRHLKARGYPWGLSWPPPKNAGNYEHERIDQMGLFNCIKEKQEDLKNTTALIAEFDPSTPAHIISPWFEKESKLEAAIQKLSNQYNKWKKAWTPVDTFEFTSPVGSFKANQLGIFDLGGNVWEWCEDSWAANSSQDKIIRGGSYMFLPSTQDDVSPNQEMYSSSYRAGVPQKEYVCFKFFDGDNWVIYPHGGFRVVLAESKLSRLNKKRALLIDVINQHAEKFIHTELYDKTSGKLDSKELEKLVDQVILYINNRDDVDDIDQYHSLWLYGDSLYIAATKNLKQLVSQGVPYTEAFSKMFLEELIVKYPDFVDLPLCCNRILNSIPSSRKEEQLSLAREYYDSNYCKNNPREAINLAYNYACYECLCGGMDKAKELLEEVFTVETKENTHDFLTSKFQWALNDEDLISLRSWLMDLKAKHISSGNIKISDPDSGPSPVPKGTTPPLPVKQEVPKKGLFSGLFKKK